ncbi:DNA polymerase I [Patescibacteria group bacterium]|nr:DNA polymerase I [Patescibacteria group bacterium]
MESCNVKAMVKRATGDGKALIIDANSLIHRAWHALPPLTAPDGTLINAVYGFSSVLLKILGQEKPSHLIVCWDTPEPTYRHKARKEYKAQREQQPDEFYAQMPTAKRVVEVFGGINVEAPGYEADDLLATFAKKLTKKGIPVILMTSDKDVWQAIAPNVQVVAFKKGVSETVVYDAGSLERETRLRPEQVADFKALRGDPSDNLKGVAGIGEKTATDLLVAYRNLDGIFKAARDPRAKLLPSIRQKLLDGEKEAREILPLVRLVDDAPVDFKEKDLRRRLVDRAALTELFSGLGFKTLLARALGKTAAAKDEVEVKSDKSEVVSDSGKKSLHKSGAPETQDLETVLKIAKSEKLLYIRSALAAQPSLFQDAPVLAVASQDKIAVITSANLSGQRIRSALFDILADAEIKKIGHNLKADWHWAKQNNCELKGLFFDIEVAAYILSGGEGRQDLNSLSAAYLNESLPEGENDLAKEIYGVRALHRVLESGLKAKSLDKFVQRFETPLIEVLAEMEDRGVLIDTKYFKILTEDFRREKSRLEEEMEKIAGEVFNPASPQQLAHILFEVLGLSSKGIKRGKTGISTAASELEKLQGAHPIIEKIVEFREVAKLLSTYVEALPLLADKSGHVHTTYNQALTATGRLSSSNPNLQNIPIRTELGRKIRHGFVAPAGKFLLSCDYSQIELRIVAALAKDEKMLDVFRRGLDIHTATASAVWSVPLEEVTKEQRRSAKAINFGIIYGQGPMGLSRATGMTFEEAKRFIDEYFLVYAGVREYLEQTKALAHARGYVETLFGRRRALPEINSRMPQFRSTAERMAVNMPVQGTSADLIKLAMIEIAKVTSEKKLKADMLLQVHDELVFEVAEKEVTRAAEIIVDIMQSIEKIGVPLVVDAKYGKNWDEMKPVEF